VETGRGGDDKVGSASAPFGFFAFSRVETEFAKGADYWLIFYFDKQSWGVSCLGLSLSIFYQR
jgi:hypothetical protein